MARTIREEERAAREKAILDAAQTLIYTKGYQEMTVQDILGTLGISKGAFYHYFDSKQSLLEAIIARMVAEVMAAMRPILTDPGLPAIAKLEALFDTAAGWKTARIGFLSALMKVWWSDENVLVRDKLYRVGLAEFQVMMQAVIEQGVAEGVMSCDYPDMAGAIVIELMQGMSNDITRILIRWREQCDGAERVTRSISAHRDAIERVLGVGSGTLRLVDPAICVAFGEASART